MVGAHFEFLIGRYMCEVNLDEQAPLPVRRVSDEPAILEHHSGHVTIAVLEQHGISDLDDSLRPLLWPPLHSIHDVTSPVIRQAG